MWKRWRWSVAGIALLAALSGLGPAKCTGSIASEHAAGGLAPGDVQHRIEHTWELARLLGAGPVPVENDSAALGCGGSGATDAGLVNLGGDLAFLVRAGPLATTCRFRTRAAVLAPGWRLESVRWSESQLRGDADACRVREGARPPDTARRIAPRRFEIVCDAASHEHGALTRLNRIELIGPPGTHWQEALVPPPEMGR